MRHHPNRSQLKGFPWRVIVYCLVLSYLICDLYLLDGPLRRRIDRARGADDTPLREKWVARVNGEPITRAQLDLAVRLYNFRRGIDTAAATPPNLRLNRLAALDELIADELLRSHARGEPTPVDPARVEESLRRFRSQFSDEESYQRELRFQKLTPAELRAHLEDHLRQIAYAEAAIADGIEVTESEARQWFSKNKSTLELPDRIRVRHIFLSTVEEDTPERESLIRELYRRCTSEEASFENLAARFSEDPRSKDKGGDLGWFSRNRMPADFAETVFALESGDLSAPFRTRLGWHIAEVTGRKPARECAFEEVREEILHLLEARKREIAVTQFLRRLRANSVVEIYPDMLE